MQRIGMKLAAPLAVLAGFAAGAANAQQVYKWVDERGVVNYSTTAPAGRAAKPLDPEASRLTVIPAMAPPPAHAAAPDRQVDERLSRLEAQAERERSAQAAIARADAERLAAMRERCERERWVDCGDDRALYARYGGTFGRPATGYGYSYGSGVVVAPPIVRAVRPVPPTQIIPPPGPPAEPARTVKSRGAPREGGATSGR